MTTEYKGADQSITGDLSVSGLAAIGPSAVSGSASGAMRYVDVAWEVADFTLVGSWRVLSSRFIVDPNANYTDIATASYNHIMVKAGNVNDFGGLIATNSIAQHFGTGTLTSLTTQNLSATLNNAGTITTCTAGSVQSLAATTATGTITNAYGLVFTSGAQGVGSTVTNNNPIIIRTPHFDGTVVNSTAILIEDQTGATNSYAIRSLGGVSEHAGFFGFGVTNPQSQVHINGSLTVKRTASPSGAYVVLLTDYIIGKTGITGGGDTVTLPDAATAGAGKVFIIKDESGAAGTDNITINTAAGNIDGSPTYVINVGYGALTVYSNGANWFVK